MSATSSDYETGNESLNSDRSESVHSENEGDMPWQLNDIADGPESMAFSQLGRRSRRHRQLMVIMQNAYYQLPFNLTFVLFSD